MGHDLTSCGACILDVDGVITETASLHFAAWKALFDDFLTNVRGDDAEPFSHQDYLDHVDGRPRYDGVAAFLASRDIELPHGTPDDPPGGATACALGNRKNQLFHEQLEQHGVERYESTVRLVEGLRARGMRTAAISASRNAYELLDRAGVLELFDAWVTGVESRELDLEGKPAPDVFVEAARRLGTEPRRSAIVEDSVAGVRAGRAGEFRLVIGVDRSGEASLERHGADVTVADLGELLPLSEAGLPRIADLEPAGAVVGAADAPAVFLDYDGTLTPIVDDPAEAILPDETRELLARLSTRVPVAVVSGRDLADVRSHVGLDELTYAGSHGFDIRLADGSRRELAEEHLDDLDRAEAELRARLDPVQGARVERKRFAVAVHDRNVARPEDREQVAAAVSEVAGELPSLRVTGGKRIHELRPDIEWDKGRAIVAVRDAMGLHDRTLVYVGDDTTDEDGFRSVKARGGVAIVVRGEDDQRRTLADGVLASPDDVRSLLEDLLAATDG